VRLKRIVEIKREVRAFLRGVITNLCQLDGVSGHVDAALKIDRQRLIAKVMKELAAEIESVYDEPHG